MSQSGKLSSMDLYKLPLDAAMAAYSADTGAGTSLTEKLLYALLAQTDKTNMLLERLIEVQEGTKE